MTTYNKTIWDETIPLNSTNLNKLETQYDNAVAWARSYGLGDKSKDISNGDLNTISGTGFYSGYTLANSPKEVDNVGYLIHIEYRAANYAMQIYYSNEANGETNHYTRQKHNGVWYDWQTLETITGAQTKVDNATKAFGLGTYSKVYEGDLNTLWTNGMYWAGSGATNKPDTGNWHLFVQAVSNSYVTQIATRNGKTLVRFMENGAWTTWAQLETTSGAQAKANEVKDWAKSFGLGGAKDTNADLNNVVDAGFYYTVSSPNAPSGVSAYGYLIVSDHPTSNAYLTQLYTPYNEARLFQRTNNNGTWSAWNEKATTANTVNKSGGVFNGSVTIEGSKITEKGTDYVSDTIGRTFNGVLHRFTEDLETNTGHARMILANGSTGAWMGRILIATDDTYYFGKAGTVSIDPAGGDARWRQSTSNYIRQNSTGKIDFMMGGIIRHSFNTDGTKSGGTIEVDGVNLGMSPIDSPQILLEYIKFNVQLTAEGTKVEINPTFIKTVEHFAVFPNNGKIIEKGLDYFVISGEGIADCRIVGERLGYKGNFYSEV